MVIHLKNLPDTQKEELGVVLQFLIPANNGPNVALLPPTKLARRKNKH
jgi:hypothetical protein